MMAALFSLLYVMDAAIHWRWARQARDLVHLELLTQQEERVA
ncbi:hypothetical protein L682_24235 [Aquipseudomonas alcaligenes OT 69]|jgi:hypothetical protein|nr:hypothetical protein L682_24235 [Pseudomonas alcaligenes OT 69]